MSETLDKFLEGTIGAVETSSYEHLCLWRDYTERKVSWKEHLMGMHEIVGEIKGLPICVSLRMDEVDGHKILFFEPTSRIVDHEVISEWLEKVMPETAKQDGRVNRTNAMNFCNIFPRNVSPTAEQHREEER